ncbi:hypothetical protein [Nitratireductor sp. GZWM139]|uniref:hypothetical protein n=1 Tax=Nitratireductor sp. GZWM139 TaxID=2950541 RepID=UPI0024BE91BF|nr:hypothetical protein [Nitratireductor sp. GZWM139]MDJ1465653.1 hypothetical protein [Nitratireductor sp. GZWM139]
MYRLVDFPEPIRLTKVTWTSGPNARNSGTTTASDGAEQTRSGIGDVVSFRLDFTLKMGREARRERGFLTSLMEGVNAARFKFIDGDMLTPQEAGIVGPFVSQPWSNGEPWSNGKGWKPSYPIVPMAAASAYDASVVTLSDAFWGHQLGIGDYLGFMPFHFGLYMITQVIAPGQYRIWPRLRKALTTDDFATLHPTLVMKTVPGGTSMARGVVHTDGQGVQLSEIIDPYVRQYFTD